MAELKKFQVEGRTERGKGPNHRLREEGVVPGVYYDADGGNIPIKVDYVALSKLVSFAGYSKVFELEILTEGKSEIKPALIKAVHHHPLKAVYNHVDFFGVDLDKKVTVAIPVQVVGKPLGVIAGGTMGIFRETLEVECLPHDIPDAIVLDVTALALGQNIHIADIVFAEGVTGVFDDNFAVVGVVAPRAGDVDDEEEEEATTEEA